MKNQILHLITAALLAVLPPLSAADAQPPSIAFETGPQGLVKFDFGGHVFLEKPERGKLAVTSITGPAIQQTAAPLAKLVPTLVKPGVVGVVGDWGAVEVGYALRGTQFEAAVTVRNALDTPLDAVTVRLAQWTWPEGVKVERGHTGPEAPSKGHPKNFLADAEHGVPAFAIGFTSGALLFALDDTGRAAINGGSMTVREIPAKGMKTMKFIVRPGPPGSRLPVLAADLFAAYAKANPVTLNWPDRRPIGAIFIANPVRAKRDASHFSPPENPAGWLGHTLDFDVRTPEGQAEFRKRLLAFADQNIKGLRAMNAQGMIVWDIEGQRPGATYYGDPRALDGMLPRNHGDAQPHPELAIAPEMISPEGGVPVVDLFFKKFTDAGFLAGVCLRPQHLKRHVRAADGVVIYTNQDAPATEERIALLDAKIAYCKQRWGVRLFYVDSDLQVEARDYRALAAKHPDVLLIPEWANEPRYWASTAPFQSAQHFGPHEARTATNIRALYPKGFCVTAAGGLAAMDDAKLEPYREGQRGGDILLINAWTGERDHVRARELYEEGRKGAPAAKR